MYVFVNIFEILLFLYNSYIHHVFQVLIPKYIIQRHIDLFRYFGISLLSVNRSAQLRKRFN